jgi:hypothetical protein
VEVAAVTAVVTLVAFHTPTRLFAARAARAWPAFVRAVEVAAVTAVVMLVAFSQTPMLSDTARVSHHAVCLPRASDSFDTTLDGVRCLLSVS